MKEILTIIEAIANEKGLKLEEVKDVFVEAIKIIAQNILGNDAQIDVTINSDEKNIVINKNVTIVGSTEELNDNTMLLEDAKKIDSSLEVGDTIKYPYNIDSLNRTDIANLYKYMETHLQRQIEDNLYNKFSEQKNKIINGVVTRVDENENTYVDIDEIKGVLSLKNRIKGEKFKVGDTIKCLIKNVHINSKNGIHIELSRTAPKFLEELLKINTPEIEDGTITVVKVSRIPGIRAKILVQTENSRVDPVGATVGVKGVRINSVSDELNGERIDCIEYNENRPFLISKLLSPAIVSNVTLEDEKVLVYIKNDQKAKAIGKNGVNIKLAKLIIDSEIELLEIDGVTEQSSEAMEEPAGNGIDKLKNLFD